MPRFTPFMVLLILALLSPARAQFDANHPELNWQMIESAHFKVYYHEGLQKFADRATEAAEEAYGPVTSFYSFEPDEKVRLILKDTDDYANGGAYYYHNTIEIWVTHLDFGLRGTTDWLRNVITHEFAHIISLQTGRKGPRRVPAIFFHYLRYQDEGKRDDILDGYPNVLTSYAVPMTIIPPWFAEGTAQYMAPGVQHDYWDSHRDMILRQAILNNTLLSWDEMGVFGAKTGLGFEKVYDHGYALTLYIVNTFGREKLAELYRNMSVLWRIDFDGAIQQALGISGQELYAQWRSSLDERYAVQKAGIDANPAQGELIHEKGYLNLHPRWSPDGQTLAFLTNEGNDYGRTRLVTYSASDSSTKLVSPNAVTAFDWSSDGTHFLYARHSQTNQDGARLWNLYTKEVQAKEDGFYQGLKGAVGLGKATFAGETQLTYDLRAIHPAYSPDQKQVAFVKNGNGNTNLGILTLASGNIHYLTAFDDGSQVFTPRWSPDGSQIAFSLYRPGGTQDIATVSPAGGVYTVRVASTGTDRDPVWTADGASLVFSCDRDGIFNLYTANLSTGQAHRITRVYGGAFQPDINPKDGRIAFSHYGKSAYEIRVVGGQGLWEPVLPEVFRIAPTEAPTAASVQTGKPYKGEYSTTTVMPRFALDSGKLKVGFVAGSDDILDKQRLFISGMFAHDFDMDLYAVYEYRKRRPTFFLEAYRLARHVEEDVVNRDENFRIYNRSFILGGVEAGGKVSLRRGGLLDARLIYNRNGTSQDVALFNGVGRTELGATTLNGFDMAFTYHIDAVARSRDSEINPRAGRQITARYDRYFNFALSGFDDNSSILVEQYENFFYNQFAINWNEFIPGPGRSAFSLRVFGGLIDKEVDNTFDFFLGGLPGMKGYSFYSLEGRRALMLRSAYRFPILSRIDRQTGPIYSDQLYGAFFAGIGRAWDGNADDGVLHRGWKREVGAELRYDATSFYLFPTRASLDVAYGVDHIPLQRRGDPLTRSGLKLYFTLLFGFLTDVGHIH
ncbi:MAG: hypothetical protein O3B73_03370 [bacterium]|nr:hypothetical protein [bacterium]